MRRSVETIRDNTPFGALLQVLGHSRYDRLPVLDGSGRLVGQICYAEISNTLFDDALVALVVARDVLSPRPVSLSSDDTLEVALRIFAENPDVTYVPVVAPDDPQHLVGIVRQNDVLAACRHL
jgi:CBS-domain-containing membrane protein